MPENLVKLFEIPLIQKLAYAIISLLVINLIVRLLQSAFTVVLKDKNETLYSVRKSLTYLGYVAAFIALIGIFSDQLGNIAVALGVAGAGIAFALQEVIASVAGWLAVSIGHFYQVGDRVQLGGTKGDVIDIGVLRTTLMEIGEWVNADLYNGRIVRIANSFVFKEPVYNYSGDFPFVWDEIKIPVKYGGDFHLAMEILNAVAVEVAGSYVDYARKNWDNMIKKYRIEKASIEPMVTLRTTDNWVEFTVRYVVDYKKRRSTQAKLYLRILEEFQTTDGKVEFASATFHLVEMPDVNVRLK